MMKSIFIKKKYIFLLSLVCLTFILYTQKNELIFAYRYKYSHHLLENYIDSFIQEYAVCLNTTDPAISSRLKKELDDYLIKAKQGDAKAQYLVAIAYLRGIGVKPNIEGFKWLRQSAIRGYPLAETVYGSLYLFHKNTITEDETSKERGLFWLEDAAKQGDKFAQFSLGLYYLHSINIEEEAYDIFSKLAAEGYPKAQKALGDLYFEGKVVHRNPSQAIYWYKKAIHHYPMITAAQQAMENLASIYENEPYQNQRKAKYWREQAQSFNKYCGKPKHAATCSS